MRQTGDTEFEVQAAKCNSLAALREAAERTPGFRSSALDSVAYVKSLLVMLLERLELKGKKFSPFAPSSEDDIDSMWSKLLIVDSTFQKDESLTKKNLPSKQGLMVFLKYCCIRRHQVRF